MTWYEQYALNHSPADEIITANNEGSPYLLRWHLIPKNRFFNIYLHRFLGDDKRRMHDHPSISLAYQLSGVLKETYSKKSGNSQNLRYIIEGKWTYRNSKFLHFLEIGSTAFPIWTLFFTGPKIRTWGFITNRGWEPWFKALNLKPTKKGSY